MSTEKNILAIQIKTEQDMIKLGNSLAKACQRHGLIFLEGELGTGKTTFCRGVLSQFGFSGLVKSPTYALVETYELSDVVIHHFDLYRLTDPEELEGFGLRDYFIASNTLQLIEWPCKGYIKLPSADLTITLTYEVFGRIAVLSSGTPHGDYIISHLKQLEG